MSFCERLKSCLSITHRDFLASIKFMKLAALGFEDRSKAIDFAGDVCISAQSLISMC